MESPQCTNPGPWAEHHQAYAAVAGTLAASKVESMKKARQEARRTGVSWAKSCKQEFGITHSQANRLICHLDRHGLPYFRLAEVASVGVHSFRRLKLADRIAGNTILLDGEVIEIAPENGARIRAAVDALRAACKPPSKPKPEPAPPPEVPRPGAMLASAEIKTILLDFHQAAAAGNVAACRSFFAPGAIFIGLGLHDAVPADQFQPAHWNLQRGVREVCLSPDINFAWFRESYSTPAGEVYRTSGAFIRIRTAWKIAQFHLARILDPAPC